MIPLVWVTDPRIPMSSMQGSIVAIPASQICLRPNFARRGIEIEVPTKARP